MLHGAGIFTYIWVILEINVDQYCTHGVYGYLYISSNLIQSFFQRKVTSLLTLKEPVIAKLF